ncbi:MAG: replication-associated recombination protein A [Chlamydiae bacterium]|nr:replication-associated recombination protein A [Chlamydiota bacterium]
MYMPLSEELRPASLEEVFGQESALDQKALFFLSLSAQKPLSLLFWGPPGCGKTTLMKIYLRTFLGRQFFFHPAFHGLTDLRKWLDEVEKTPLLSQTALLAIDEIHRMTRVQQDALLPYLERGTCTLIGATTENPSFCLQGALLSRIRVIPLKTLEVEALHKILQRALHKKGLSSLSMAQQQWLVHSCKGDARHLLNSLENLLAHPSPVSLSEQEFYALFSQKPPLYDKHKDAHYGLISVLHKSIRGSDPDAALYWLSRMLEAGEDPNYLARRLVRIAVEDIGLADPTAQRIALEAWQTYERLGSPEGELALAQAVLFLSLAPKSNSVYTAFSKAKEVARATSHLPPKNTFIQPANTFMRTQGFGLDYQYDHEVEGGVSGQDYFPEGLCPQNFYEPKELGFERDMKKRKTFFAKKRKDRGTK